MARTWIQYNKPEEPNYTHAGLRLALGLHGHLSVLTIAEVYRYLSQMSSSLFHISVQMPLPSYTTRFRQLQQEKQAKAVAAPVSNELKFSVPTGNSTFAKPAVIANKRPLDIKANDGKKPSPSSSNGKLAFSFKKKSKVVALAVKLVVDDEEEGGFWFWE